MRSSGDTRRIQHLVGGMERMRRKVWMSPSRGRRAAAGIDARATMADRQELTEVQTP